MGVPQPNFLRAIAVRIIILSWLVSILTLSIFVMAIIPGQKQDLQEALRSKALGVSSSLQDVTAGAALSEDYSSVVDHCVQVLAGDEAIDYIVVTKNDGLSVVVERNNWRVETLGGFWLPTERKISAGIQVVPGFGRRVFHFTRPFNYSAIQWGWIHVGLSLATYDSSVSRIIHRTWLIALLCMVLSLLVSVIYAKLQVRPILSLQAVVGQIEKGDLSARAGFHGGKEISSLARSFNMMAESLSQRNQILESVRFAAQQFLTASDPSEVIAEVLGKVGQAAQASRAFVVENNAGGDRGARPGLRYDWSAPGMLAGESGTDPLDPIRNAGLPEGWAGQLSCGEIVCARSRDLRSLEEPVSPHPALCTILIPIYAVNEWFGFLGFCDCVRERDWSEAERDTFRAVAGMLGASITRQRAQDALLEAKETLEKRVTERTRELQDQVNAKERALAELAQAQQRLMELSRMSGMAEIATGVLHNVGNVLNSVNVSATIAAGKILEFRVDKLANAVDMLQQHPNDMDAFLHHDPKGQRLMPYLVKLGKDLQDDRQGALTELRQLQNHVDHIKTIVATQQSYAKVSGLVEDVCLADLVEDALRIVQPSLERHRIRTERTFEKVPPIVTDKHKILQILLNLLRNAKEAIKLSDQASRLIRIGIRCHGGNRVRIEVKDSGIGLAQENLTRIFAHGFTTKRDGHGFGLHSGALDAQQMAGSLWAESEGLGLGATFILDLPLTRVQERSRA
jgi:two-component system NtrC family sensor kinase